MAGRLEKMNRSQGSQSLDLPEADPPRTLPDPFQKWSSGPDWNPKSAAMAELADALDSGSSERKLVEVRLLLAAIARSVCLAHRAGHRIQSQFPQLPPQDASFPIVFIGVVTSTLFNWYIRVLQKLAMA